MMKYFSKKQILESLQHLSNLNQFFGLTFLAAKRANLPVGVSATLSIDSLNHALLREYYALDPRSEYFFRVFRFNNKNKFWWKPDYYAKGLQKLNTTSFRDAFIHDAGSRSWGWQVGYVDILAAQLEQDIKIPAFDLAVWLFRSRPWNEADTRKEPIKHLFSYFSISDEEREKLFNPDIISNITKKGTFQDIPTSWQEIEAEFEAPPDVGPEKGGILTFLEIEGIGPLSVLRFDPGRRLNIITGDNGLGKSFLLEVAWWALTGTWAGQPAYPIRRLISIPKGRIKFQISGVSTGEPQLITYDGKKNAWPKPEKRATIPGLVVYSRVDGSYAVWDPAGRGVIPDDQTVLILDREQVWDGKSGRIEGLIRDWAKWQDNPGKYPFDTFFKVMKCMAPPEMEDLSPGDTLRLPFDPREMPSIRHHYGDVPIIYESAGIKHIITLTYLMVWVWNEHRVLAKQLGRHLENRMVIIVDEMEVHLHPRWQRVILPALMNVARILSSDLETQLIIASHSPLVLASAETIFDNAMDKLFHLEVAKNGSIEFTELPFSRYGEVGSWLTSRIFQLQQPRSREAELVLNRAIELQKEIKPDIEEIRQISKELAEVLPAEDDFWPRWVFFAQEYGIDL